MSTKQKPQLGSNKPPRDLNAIAADIHRLQRNRAFEVGELLAEAQEACEHGQWMTWLDNEFDWSHDTAMRYVSAYRLADKFRTVRNLPIPSRVVYALASDLDDPDLPAIIEMLAEETKGSAKQISVGDADDVIRIVKARREYGDYPDVALFAMSLVDDGSPEGDATVAALKAARPTTDEATAEIVSACRRAYEAEEAKAVVEEEAETTLERDSDADDSDADDQDAGDPEASADCEDDPDLVRIDELREPLLFPNEITSLVFGKPGDPAAIDEALDKIEKQIAALNALAEHLKAMRAKAASLASEGAPAEPAVASA
jgi:hypothetical protein